MKNPLLLEGKIGEFQKFIGAENYNPVLDRVLRQLDATSITSTALYDGLTESKLQHIRINANPKEDAFYICIRTNEPEGQRKVLLYDLLHEWGHFQDEDRLPIGREHDPHLQLGREQRAWKFADLEFARHLELAPDRPAYEAYKQRCLATYLSRCRPSPVS